MKKLKITFAIISIIIIASISAFAQNPSGGQSGALKVKGVKYAPDLRIRKFVFVPTNKKGLRVYVQNVGNKPAVANRLLLRIRKINGNSVNRKKAITVPPIGNGEGVWLSMNAKNILPNDVALKSTIFGLMVDSTKIVKESNEKNNRRYYKAKKKTVSAPGDFTIKKASADLRIRQIKFVGTSKKVMAVQVYNAGSANAQATNFVLAIGKINGIKVNRRKSFNMPKLAKGKFVWVKINAKSLLPNSVSLKSTTFRLTVDIPDIVNESNESNNNYYHKP